ncbi:hypothetical protein DPMN_191210 [Dreissena polymorpha]|uniref:Uncharacterized protein n=1 Tax=Dreissena polymorpha TaxID=45954 RepID=A0A9D3Y0W4_DREPO|nr:hypothetical protein DPMN_191210 [Dreissena polymorpha]
MPIPSGVASSVPAPPQSLGLPQMRAGEETKRHRQSSLCRSVTSEASSMAPSAHSPWCAADNNVPAQFRETSAEYWGHFRAPRSPPAPIMRPFPTHFTTPNNQPVVSGVLLYNNQPVVSGLALPSNQPVVSGISLYNKQPVVSGVSLSNNQPVVSGVSLPNNQPVVSGVSLPNNQPVVNDFSRPNNQPVVSCFSMPNNPPVVSSVPV